MNSSLPHQFSRDFYPDEMYEMYQPCGFLGLNVGNPHFWMVESHEIPPFFQGEIAKIPNPMKSPLFMEKSSYEILLKW